MKHGKTFAAIVFLFLITTFLIGCGGDDGQEQARIEYVKNLSAQFSTLKIWSHGPKHTYATLSSDDTELTEESAKRVLEATLTMPAYVQMIELGFTKFYFYSPGIKIELYADKNENCWKLK